VADTFRAEREDDIVVEGGEGGRRSFESKKAEK
jgi:hypothetical protein